MAHFDTLPTEKQFKTLLDRIATAQEKLSKAENNLQYIKGLQSLKNWLEKFENFCHFNRQYFTCGEYLQLFTTCCGFSFYERVLNSIQEYNYGNKPF
jgi:hypothetical protein